MTKGKEKGRSNAPPYSRHTIYFKSVHLNCMQDVTVPQLSIAQS